MRTELLAQHRAHLVGVGRGGDHEARGRADDQRRHLRHETVADRENGVRARGLADVHAALDDTDEDAADDVDDDDENAEDRVALHVLGGTVHAP